MKKNPFNKILIIPIIATLICPSVTMAQSAETADNQSIPRFEPSRKYTFDLKDSKPSIRVKGSSIQMEGNKFIIQDPREDKVQEIPIESIQMIREKNGSYALLGAGIGAASGGALAATIALTGSCSGDSDPGDCESINDLAIAIGIPSGVVLGGLLGLGIGSAIPKEKKISISPIISPVSKNQIYGLGVTKQF